MTVVTRDELVLEARKLAPALARRARECERLRRLPDETIADFKRAGLLRAFVPPEHGGYGLEIGTVIDTTREVGRACGNSAWCLAICMLHNHIAAAYPETVRARVFANGPDPIVCGVFMPGGRATAAAGGFRLSGAWDFASTCDHAEFAVLAAFLHDEPDGPPRGMGSCLIERASFSIEDNWHVSGLCGTGSKRVIVEDVLVPEDHVLIGSLEGGIAPDREVARGGGPGLPGNSVATLGLVGVALGIAEGALERFRGRIATKLRFTSGKSPEQQIGAQLRYAQSAAEVDAAGLVVHRDLDEMTADALAGRTASLAQRARYRRDAAWTIQTCARAVAHLQPAAGGHAAFLDDPMQRAVRDIQVMATHIVADWDASAEAYARAMVGLPKLDPLV
jgi:3-hydroxy-9,10-secoandrosta-1,3,5(10)-triene-9,17-dione monooxygenase